ncbi:hypothetical protein SAMN02745174_00332 [Cetobacterium ceti]|uniref:Malate permease n=1 Tax=Cetobacterium ceti TaxID=180163 RepID=A0A1T4K642_9FUSO|nr:AEC family transporter [Cetobacterium ceti]SJZ37910.1 hypothetical protein SAMN02745174_00332 [Cetobacterium ceti]
MFFLTTVESLLIILIISALGYFLKKYDWFDDKFGKSISRLVIKVALPCAIFMSVLKHITRENLLNLSGDLIYPIVTVVISYTVAYILTKVMKIPVGRRGIFMNGVANTNVVSIGLPLNMALFGSDGMAYFLIFYLVNTFSTWCFGVYLIANDTPNVEENKEHKINWGKIFPPPMIGLFIAIVYVILDLPVPRFVGETLGFVGGLTVPLSLIYVGIRVFDAGISSIKFDRDTIVALCGRFILAPAIMVCVLLIAMKGFDIQLSNLLVRTFVVQSGVPMLAVLPILAGESGGDVKYATNLLVSSTVLFIVVVPILGKVIGWV